MSETIVKDQGVEDRNESSNINQESEVTRRDFVQLFVAVAAALGLNSLLPPFARKALAEVAPPPCPPGQPLQTILEIRSSSARKVLQAVSNVLDEN